MISVNKTANSPQIMLLAKRDIINFTITFLTFLAGIFLLISWFFVSPTLEIEMRIATTRNDILKKLAFQKVNIKGTFQAFNRAPSALRGVWSRFRGSHFDNVSKEKVKLKGLLNKNDLLVLWTVFLGEGYAGPAIANGCVYILDYDDKTGSDVLRCLSFDTGKEIWRRAYRISVKRNHGMSRTVPAVTDKYVVSIGPKCHVLCVDARTGAFKWGIDLVTEYETRVPLWYTGQCPVIDDNIAVLAPAGKYLMIGVDCETGNVVWKTPNPHSWEMSHSSVIPMKLAGQKTYVYCAKGGMVGVAANGINRGKILWETTEWSHSVISPSPVKVSDDRIFVTAGYGAGSMMFKVIKNGNDFSIQSLFKLSKEVFACEQHTPVFYREHLFSVLPKDGGELKQQLVCMQPDGRIAWTSGRNKRFGLGPFIIADNKIFILDDNGVLTIAKAGMNSYVELSRTKILHDRESWAPIAIANGRMILRDFTSMVCLDLRANKEPL